MITTVRLLSVLALGALAAAPVAHAATYELEPNHTTIGFAAKHLVISTVRGSFKEYTGSFDYDAADPAATKATATIKAASITTGNERRDNHLRTPDFFNVEQFPEITFVSTSAEKSEGGVLLHGNLTMRGVTKEVAIPVTVSGPIIDPQGSERVGLEGSATINRQDFGVSWNKTLDNGGLVVSDNVKIELSIEGVKKP